MDNSSSLNLMLTDQVTLQVAWLSWGDNYIYCLKYISSVVIFGSSSSVLITTMAYFITISTNLIALVAFAGFSSAIPGQVQGSRVVSHPSQTLAPVVSAVVSDGATVTSTVLGETDLPYPWWYPTISRSLGGDTCSATLNVLSQNPCGRDTNYITTTTSYWPIDCLGCSSVTVTKRSGGCPLGGSGGHGTGIIQGTRTVWTFSCSTSGQTTPTIPPAKTLTLPIPTIAATLISPTSGTGPAWTPTGITAIVSVDGWCVNELRLGPVDDGVTSRECAESYPWGSRPTSYISTIWSSIYVPCDVCTVEMAVQNTRHGCPENESRTDQVPAVTATEPKTQWTYTCLTTTLAV
jgi:hypothetical protein